ncbi:DNA cytosine methyltransferase [Clostridium perfringens]|uniref:DNA cytosine methyltransferase n=1 Tax=Clostridium perfringens TaxID=1502 RepID=UPI0024BD2AFE|nr:DNA cytosine methyltransferase [Clostridium perfringens]
MIKILELFGGIGSPRKALVNLGVPVKAIDYVEIDEKAVRSYNEMFKKDLEYKTQSVVGYNLKPDILIHGSPCQDFSIAGKQRGADEGSQTRSSLMWETLNIIKQMGVWKPRVVIWENVKNVLSKHMIHNFNRYLTEKECWRLQGYSDEDFEAALNAHPGRKGKLNGVLYKQAGNSIPVTIFESIFKQLLDI